MNTDEQDDLWKLLGKAKKPDVSPFFARNVLREIRAQKPAPFRFLLTLKRLTAALAASALLLVGVGMVALPHLRSGPSTASNHTALRAPDLETLNHLDELLAYEESSTWLDNSPY